MRVAVLPCSLMATMPTAGDDPLLSSPNNDNQVARTGSEDGEHRELQNGEVTQVNGAAAVQPLGQEDSRGSYFALAKGLILRALVIYFITSFFRGPQVSNVSSEARKPSINTYQNGTVMDMYVYVSEEESITDFSSSKELVWFENGLVYGDWYSGPNGDGSFVNNIKIMPSERVLKKNGTLYLHVYFVKAGKSPDPKAKSSYSRKSTVYKRKVLTRLKKRVHKTQRLLIGDQPPVQETPLGKVGELTTHWHPNLTINIVNDQTQWIQGSVPPPLDEYVEFEPTNGKYYPVVYVNDYWNLQRDYQPINETTPILNLALTYQPISLFRWQMYSAQSMRSRWTSSFLGDSATEESEEDQDSLKEAFIETNPYLLGLTIVVSIFHTVFELLAFKNDIQFWKNRNSLEGLSVRSVMLGVVQSLIVLLYVMDNETNTLVRISVFVGLAIDLWKIQKVVNINVNREQRLLGILPKITFSDKGSYVESSTREYDVLAFRYLSWLLYPLILGYAVYSLLYLEHKGWYSWFLSMLYGFLLTFGFIMMTPQLFINYKLKSVAHMPWRMMTYKALNTFIDDIFAFVIKMPTLYRIGCFRDDIIFFIFLYQRWIYRVDPSRINEFGISAEMEQEMNSQLKQLQSSQPSEESEPLVEGDKKND